MKKLIVISMTYRDRYKNPYLTAKDFLINDLNQVGSCIAELRAELEKDGYTPTNVHICTPREELLKEISC